MERRVGYHYKLGPRIGSGSFGEIYAGTHSGTSEDVAIKTEPVRTRCPQLQNECKIYRLLRNNGKTFCFLSLSIVSQSHIYRLIHLNPF